MNTGAIITLSDLRDLAVNLNQRKRPQRLERMGTREADLEVAKSIMRRIEFSASGCWNFTGYTTKYGYGRAGIGGGETDYVHRLTYAFVFGPIPENHCVDHLCRNTSCANPEHLEAVTYRTNILRGVSICAASAGSSECINGHIFTTENTYITKAGHRQCRECRRIKDRRYMARARILH